GRSVRVERGQKTGQLITERLHEIALALAADVRDRLGLALAVADLARKGHPGWVRQMAALREERDRHRAAVVDLGVEVVERDAGEGVVERARPGRQQEASVAAHRIAPLVARGKGRERRAALEEPLRKPLPGHARELIDVRELV